VYITFAPYSPTPFTYTLPHPTRTYLIQELFCLPILHFCDKKCHSYLLTIAIQVVSLWHFHVRIHYNLNWFIPSIFFSFLPKSPSYGDFNRFKNSIFILI
jgi:hypothetical protein